VPTGRAVGWISPIIDSMARRGSTAQPMHRPFSPGSQSACTGRELSDVARGASSTTPRSLRLSGTPWTLLPRSHPASRRSPPAEDSPAPETIILTVSAADRPSRAKVPPICAWPAPPCSLFDLPVSQTSADNRAVHPRELRGR
jgi:hypothetical protein